MGRYLKIFGFALVVATLFALIISKGLQSLENNSDFKKLFSEKHQSMMIGTSRMAKIRDHLVEEALKGKGKGIYNFAFNLETTPYGPLYYQRIREKLPEEFDSGIFVLGVDPWTVSAKENRKSDSTKFKENGTLVSFNPNQRFGKIRYFFTHYNKPYYSLFLPKPPESNIETRRPDSAFVAMHIKSKMANYRKMHFNDEVISDLRYSYLEKTIELLKTKGTVYIVRLPVSQEMLELEEEYAPEFDDKLEKTVRELQVNLIDLRLVAPYFLCPDGNHLYDADADTVSLMIGEMIRIRESGQMDGGDELLSLYLQYEGSQFVPHKLRESLTLVEDEK